MDSDKAADAAKKARRLESGTGDAMLEGLGATGLISAGVTLLVRGHESAESLLSGIALLVAGVSIYAIRRHYRALKRDE